MLQQPTTSRTGRALRALIAGLCLFTLMGAMVAPALAVPPSEERIMKSPGEDGSVNVALDALFLRPIGFLSLAAGIALFVPAAAMTLITRPLDIGKPFHLLVIRPAKYVWVDPLGHHGR